MSFEAWPTGQVNCKINVHCIGKGNPQQKFKLPILNSNKDNETSTIVNYRVALKLNTNLNKVEN